MKCNCCGSERSDHIYSPIGSETSLKIKICKDCGLVFADSEEVDYSNIKNFEFRNIPSGLIKLLKLRIVRIRTRVIGVEG